MLGVAALALCVGAAPAWASDPVRAGAAVAADVQNRGVQAWLEQMHEASRGRSYTGTFVVSSGSEMAASRIWHVCNGKQQVERIETLTGAPRTTLRRNDEVITFTPDNRLAVRERRESLRLFPDMLRAPGQQIDTRYQARLVGAERVAGFDAWVVDFLPRDQLRYGYRLWSEKRSGLVLKLQTRDTAGRVLEQVAFTELQIDAPVQMEALLKQMDNTAGYRVVRPELRQTTPEAEGWRLRQEVAGFQSVGCHARVDAQARTHPAVQWVFSDGLASVSLFLERFDPRRHTQEQAGSAGATHSVTRRIGEHWVTAMGEVPPETLQLFVQLLERTR